MGLHKDSWHPSLQHVVAFNILYYVLCPYSVSDGHQMPGLGCHACKTGRSLLIAEYYKYIV